MFDSEAKKRAVQASQTAENDKMENISDRKKSFGESKTCIRQCSGFIIMGSRSIGSSETGIERQNLVEKRTPWVESITGRKGVIEVSRHGEEGNHLPLC